MMVEDMAKIGQLFRQKGRWEAGGEVRQIISEDWLREAAKVQATNEDGDAYEYHIRIGGTEDRDLIILSGMFSQFIVVAPALDMVVVVTAGAEQSFTRAPAFLLLRRFLRALDAAPAPLPNDPDSYAGLCDTLAGLHYRGPFPQRAAEGHDTDDFSAFCGKKWSFPKNRASVLPMVIQMMDNLVSLGVRALSLRAAGDELYLRWLEGTHLYALPLGAGWYKKSLLRTGRESFWVAAAAKAGRDAAGAPVLDVRICFLEHSSSRVFRLMRQRGGLLLEASEEPGLLPSLGILEQQPVAARENRSALVERLLRNKGMQMCISQLCMPNVRAEEEVYI